jgi:hypothetical protein
MTNRLSAGDPGNGRDEHAPRKNTDNSKRDSPAEGNKDRFFIIFLIFFSFFVYVKKKRFFY